MHFLLSLISFSPAHPVWINFSTEEATLIIHSAAALMLSNRKYFPFLFLFLSLRVSEAQPSVDSLAGFKLKFWLSNYFVFMFPANVDCLCLRWWFVFLFYCGLHCSTVHAIVTCKKLVLDSCRVFVSSIIIMTTRRNTQIRRYINTFIGVLFKIRHLLRFVYPSWT